MNKWEPANLRYVVWLNVFCCTNPVCTKGTNYGVYAGCLTAEIHSTVLIRGQTRTPFIVRVYLSTVPK